MVQRNWGIVDRVARMFGGRRQDTVADLRQDIFYDLCRGYPTFRGDCDERTWVYRVALNRAISHIRRRRREPLIVGLDEEALNRVDDIYADPLVDRLHHLADHLADDDRALLLLYLDGLSSAQMAAVSERSVSTVKNQLSAIRKKLKQLNENEE